MNQLNEQMLALLEILMDVGVGEEDATRLLSDMQRNLDASIADPEKLADLLEPTKIGKGGKRYAKNPKKMPTFKSSVVKGAKHLYPAAYESEIDNLMDAIQEIMGDSSQGFDDLDDAEGIINARNVDIEDLRARLPEVPDLDDFVEAEDSRLLAAFKELQDDPDTQDPDSLHDQDKRKTGNQSRSVVGKEGEVQDLVDLAGDDANANRTAAGEPVRHGRPMVKIVGDDAKKWVSKLNKTHKTNKTNLEYLKGHPEFGNLGEQFQNVYEDQAFPKNARIRDIEELEELAAKKGGKLTLDDVVDYEAKEGGQGSVGARGKVNTDGGKFTSRQLDMIRDITGDESIGTGKNADAKAEAALGAHLRKLRKENPGQYRAIGQALSASTTKKGQKLSAAERKDAYTDPVKQLDAILGRKAKIGSDPKATVDVDATLEALRDANVTAAERSRTARERLGQRRPTLQDLVDKLGNAGDVDTEDTKALMNLIGGTEDDLAALDKELLDRAGGEKGLIDRLEKMLGEGGLDDPDINAKVSQKVDKARAAQMRTERPGMGGRASAFLREKFGIGGPKGNVGRSSTMPKLKSAGLVGGLAVGLPLLMEMWDKVSKGRELERDKFLYESQSKSVGELVEQIRNEQSMVQNAAGVAGTPDPMTMQIIQQMAAPSTTGSEMYIGPNLVSQGLQNGQLSLEDLLSQMR